VLDVPEFKGLLSEKPTSVFMNQTDYSAGVRDVFEPGGLFELRTYTANPGKLDALNARFKEHTTRILKRHGIANVAYWTAFDDPEAGNTLIYLVRHAGRDKADANWNAFKNDPEWRKVAHASQIDGRILVEPPQSEFLSPLPFSPLK